MKTYEAFSSIVHKPELESLLIGEGLSQRFPQRVRRKDGLITILELGEDDLKRKHLSKTVSF